VLAAPVLYWREIDGSTVFFMFVALEKMSNRSTNGLLSASNNTSKVGPCPKTWTHPSETYWIYKGNLRFCVIFGIYKHPNVFKLAKDSRRLLPRSAPIKIGSYQKTSSSLCCKKYMVFNREMPRTQGARLKTSADGHTQAVCERQGIYIVNATHSYRQMRAVWAIDKLEIRFWTASSPALLCAQQYGQFVVEKTRQDRTEK
jgi:hypothetical protein